MAVDIEAIKRRIAELNGERKRSDSNFSVKLWKPEVGQYRVRGLPWKNPKDGLPFEERWYYYIGANFGALTLKQFGQPDPIADFVNTLYRSGKEQDRELAKKLRPKVHQYMPIIIRDDESKGILVWKLNNEVYKKLLNYWVDAEIGDILDPKVGWDLKVTVSKSGKKFNNRDVLAYDVEAVRNRSPLSSDPAQAKSWLDAVPNIDDLDKRKTAHELETMLSEWLSSPESTVSDGESRGSSVSDGDALDKLVSEVKTDKAKTSPPASTKKPRKPVVDDDDDETPAPALNLDDAFEDLMKS